MTQNSDPYENAVAERVNGILKQEFMIDNYHRELRSYYLFFSCSRRTKYSAMNLFCNNSF